MFKCYELGSGVVSLIGAEVTIEVFESSELGSGVVSSIGVEVTIAGVRYFVHGLFLSVILFDTLLGVSSMVSIYNLTFF